MIRFAATVLSSFRDNNPAIELFVVLTVVLAAATQTLQAQSLDADPRFANISSSRIESSIESQAVTH